MNLISSFSADPASAFLAAAVLLAALLIAVPLVAAAILVPGRKAARAYAELRADIWAARNFFVDKFGAPSQTASIEAGTLAAVSQYEEEGRLLACIEAAQNHYETAFAWLQLGRMGFPSVHCQCDLGFAELCKFRRIAGVERRKL